MFFSISVLRRTVWSKHWHTGRMRPTESFCAARERFLYAVYYTKS